MTMNATVTLSTPQLQVGMVVRVHGARFRLTHCTHTAADAAFNLTFSGKLSATAIAGVETLRAFSTELLGDVYEGHPHSIPASYLNRDGDGNAWSIQGNHNAFWTVELEGVPAEIDSVVRRNTAFRSLFDMLLADGRYRPSLDVREPVMLQIADAYDAAQALRGDDRRAYRYGSAA